MNHYSIRSYSVFVDGSTCFQWKMLQ